MKKFYTIILACLCSTAFAQTRVTTTDYQKISRSALVNEIPFSAKLVEDAIDDALAKKGYKGNSAKGFTVYKGARLISDEAYDIYFMVEKKSKKDKDNSVVTMMVSKGFDEFLTEKNDGPVLEKARHFLDSLRNTVARYDLEQQIIVQEDEVKSADKKHVSLQDESKDLEKKKRKLEEQISDNINNLENQLKEIEKQKQILETLKARRT
jgi:hypothetical protein